MKILIVEDEIRLSEVLKKNLETEYFIVDVANDGEMGAKMALEHDYDLIILDQMLPKKTGMEICKELRQAGKKTPIIILSVKSETTTKVELLNAGADDYLIKPFSFEELVARIRALMRRPQEIKEDVYKADDLVLDTKRQTVKRGDKDIYLTRKEFMLLEYLLRNKDVVLSRAMIMEHVWDMYADPFSNTIESHILSLRKKIDLPNRQKLIQTVPGRGYKLSFV